jgi:hypothetical protein
MKTERSELRAYLLGRLPDLPADDLDARMFAEDDLYRELEGEQESLIEDFLQSRLSPEDEATFRAQCARSPELKGRVDSLRALLVALDTQPSQNLHPMSWYRHRFFFFASPALAALLLVVGFLYLRGIRENANLRTRLETLAQSPRPIVQPIDGHPALLAFLSADIPRGPSAPREFAIPTTASLIELQIELRNPFAGESRWNVEVLRGAETVWKSANVPLRRVGQKAYLALLIDSGDLLPGSYLVRYSPSSDPGASQSRLFHIAQEP